MKILLGFILSILCPILYAGPIDWSVAMTSFPSDQSVGDTGHEKTPNGYVDLMTGNVVFDVPEVTLKGDRGLNFTLSRSYGKVNNGFRSMGNWEFDVPRLVMNTGPSTVLQGDQNGKGICEANGDATNNTSGRPRFSATLLNTPFKDRIEKTYVNQVNVNLANQTLTSIINILQYFASLTSDPNAQYNNQQAQAAYTTLQNQLFDAFKTNVNAISISDNDAKAKKAQYKQSLTDTLDTGQTEIYVNGYRLTKSNISTVLDDLTVTSNLRVTTNNVYLDGVIRQVVIGYLYYLNIEQIKSPFLLDGMYSTSSLRTSSDVDSRQRVISLYLPGQKNIIFYPTNGKATGYPSSAKYVSQDNWFISCAESGSDFVVRSNSGITYYFPSTNRENQTGFTSFFSSQYIPGKVTIYASKIENQYKEGYLLNYFNKQAGMLLYSGFKNTNKIFIKSVQHTLDGQIVNKNSPEIVLEYVKSLGGTETIDESKFDSLKGDILLKKVKRFLNGNYKEWVSYTYSAGLKAGSNYKLTDAILSNDTIGAFQDRNAAKLYLDKATYISGDVIAYTYGGPYRVVGNASPSESGGVTTQEFLWFYSDLTAIKYYKYSSSNLINSLSVNWDYELVNMARPGFIEQKAFRVKNSTYSAVNANSYQITYGYNRDDALHEQSTTVTTKDVSTGFSKAYTYIMHAFSGGNAENFLHGLLKKIKIGDREENYVWTTLSLIGQKTKTTDNNYTDYEDVRLVRLAQKIINHFGEYKTVFSNFDAYGQAQTIQKTGLNGAAVTQFPSSTVTFYNSDYANSSVNSGSLPWIIGLPKQRKSGTFTLQTTEYDSQGAIRSDVQAGRTTKYKYETVSFATCLGNLADFQWSKFVSCISNYVLGDLHVGLPIEVDVGNGKQITQFAAYKKGIPTRTKLSNGGTETSIVDDFGNITQHTDADNITTRKQFDDAGRLRVDTPIVGLGTTTINYDGLTITKNLSGGSPLKTIEKYNGDGLLISSEAQASNKTIIRTNKYDAFGNQTFASNPSVGGGSSVGVTSNYDLFSRPISVNDNGSIVTYCYQSCGGKQGAITKTTDAYGSTEANFLAGGDFNADLKTQVVRKGTDGSIFQTSTVYDLAILKPKTAVSGKSTQSFTYNSNATLATEKDNGITGQKSFGYDVTGRIINVTHPDSSVETIVYSPINDAISTRNWRGITTSYTYSLAGRLKTSTNGNTNQIFDLDNYGRIKKHTQTITTNDNNRSYAISYGYNALNQITSIQYPNGKSVSLSNQNAFGEIAAIPNVIQSLGYNALHQLTTVQANQDVNWSYKYLENGLPKNVSAAGLNNNCLLNIDYGYDSLNRIDRLTDKCTSIYNVTVGRYGTGLMSTVELDQARYQYNYDNDDITKVNIISKGQVVSPAIYTYNYLNNTSKLGSVSGSAYRFSYDNMGNVINDGIRALTYDAYDRVTTNGNESYFYNTDGLRVRAVRSDGTTDYIYDLNGNLLYDINYTSNYSRAYVYIADKLVATLERYPDTNKGFDFVNDFEAAELGVTKLSDSYLDSDGDGLPDYIERFIGSDPFNPDTDGDGHKDGYEYRLLGAKGVLNPSIKPSEPDPTEDVATLLPPILDLILSDD